MVERVMTRMRMTLHRPVLTDAAATVAAVVLPDASHYHPGSDHAEMVRFRMVSEAEGWPSEVSVAGGGTSKEKKS